MGPMNNLTGKTMVITGANSGIGKETARELGKMGAKIVLVCRNKQKGEEALKELERDAPGKFDLIIADMASLKSVEGLAEKLKTTYPKIDVLLHNAGVFFQDHQLSPDGIEMTMAVNHIGVFHLTMLMLDHMKNSAPSRIIIVASEAHRKAKIDLSDLQFNNRNFKLLHAYGQSKLMNLLFMRELDKKLAGTGVTINCLHPGVVGTNIVAANSGLFLKTVWAVGSKFMMTPAKGALTSIRCASDPALEKVSNKYFEKENISDRINPLSTDQKLAADLWVATEKLIRDAGGKVAAYSA